MHVIFGILGLAATLALTVALEHTQVRFTGLLYGPALLLLLAAPPCIALTSHGVEQLAATAHAVWGAIRFSARSFPARPSRAQSKHSRHSWCNFWVVRVQMQIAVGG